MGHGSGNAGLEEGSQLVWRCVVLVGGRHLRSEQSEGPASSALAIESADVGVLTDSAHAAAAIVSTCFACAIWCANHLFAEVGSAEVPGTTAAAATATAVITAVLAHAIGHALVNYMHAHEHAQ